jgi:hypothetical protein
VRRLVGRVRAHLVGQPLEREALARLLAEQLLLRLGEVLLAMPRRNASHATAARSGRRDR